jgi:hypothetical protein
MVEMARVVAAVARVAAALGGGVRAAVGMVVVMAEAVTVARVAETVEVASVGAARVEGKSGRLGFA